MSSTNGCSYISRPLPGGSITSPAEKHVLPFLGKIKCVCRTRVRKHFVQRARFTPFLSKSIESPAAFFKKNILFGRILVMSPLACPYKALHTLSLTTVISQPLLTPLYPQSLIHKLANASGNCNQRQKKR